MIPTEETRDAVSILRDRRIGNDPEQLARLHEEQVNADAAQLIHDARTGAGLSQKELAALVGTTQSVINRLEDADDKGRSLAILARIAQALDDAGISTATAPCLAILARIAQALGTQLTITMTDRGGR